MTGDSFHATGHDPVDLNARGVVHAPLNGGCNAHLLSTETPQEREGFFRAAVGGAFQPEFQRAHLVDKRICALEDISKRAAVDGHVGGIDTQGQTERFQFV